MSAGASWSLIYEHYLVLIIVFSVYHRAAAVSTGAVGRCQWQRSGFAVLEIRLQASVEERMDEEFVTCWHGRSVGRANGLGWPTAIVHKARLHLSVLCCFQSHLVLTIRDEGFLLVRCGLVKLRLGWEVLEHAFARAILRCLASHAKHLPIAAISLTCEASIRLRL